MSGCWVKMSQIPIHDRTETGWKYAVVLFTRFVEREKCNLSRLQYMSWSWDVTVNRLSNRSTCLLQWILLILLYQYSVGIVLVGQGCSTRCSIYYWLRGGGLEWPLARLLIKSVWLDYCCGKSDQWKTWGNWWSTSVEATGHQWTVNEECRGNEWQQN